ncbi:MAG: AAA family ATPase [Desulfobacterales bacterium]|nr:AAA family ATPase [Desulfobacterales bacterium]
MKDILIETSRVSQFRQAISVVEDTVKGHPGIMVVWGYSGRGKSSCVEDYAVNTGALYLYVQNQLTPLVLMQQLCRELNGMEPYQKARAKRIIVEELDDTPRTLLIDEADKLCIHCIEHLRDIHDLTGIPLVLVGEPSLYGKLHSRTRLWSRVTRTVEFGPVTVEDIIVLGVKACDLKIKPDAARVLLKRCKGDFRPLYHDLRDLEGIAASNNLSAIETDMIQSIPERRIKPTPEKEV